MTNQELVKVVLENQDGILVTAEVNAVLYRVPKSRLTASSLEVMNLNTGICVLTGLGLTWQSPRGTGQYFMPMFRELRPGERYTLDALQTQPVRESFHFAVSRPRETQPQSDLLIRVATTHGQPVLALPVQVIRRAFEGDLAFEIPTPPEVDPDS